MERKELSVGAMLSAENVSDIGTKRLSVPTMKYLMHNLGVYDSETSTLVGQDEYDMRVSKHNLKLITTSSNVKVSANLIRLIVASSLAPTDALSCGTLFSAMDMAWIDWSFLDNAAVNFLKFGRRKQTLQHKREEVTRHPEGCHLTTHVTCNAV